MWIKVRNSIVSLDGNAIIRREGNIIRLELTDELQIGRRAKIAEYVNMARAKEVMEDFWKAATAGEHGYEFPEV